MATTSNVEWVQELIARYDERLYPSSPSPDEELEPSSDPEDRRAKWEPNKTIVSVQQFRMDGAWDLMGAPGLAQSVYIQAAATRGRQDRAHWTWNRMVDDRKGKVPHTFGLIQSIPPEIVTAIIRGNIESRRHHDPKFELLLDKHTRLEPTPGVYLNILCRGKWGDMVPGTQVPTASPHAGKGLTLRQLETLYTRLELYMEDTTESHKYVDKVDRAMPSAKAQSPWRVYLSDDPKLKHIEKVKEFMAFMKQEYLLVLDEAHDKNDPRFDIPMDRGFSEIGWSKNVARRAPDHLSHNGTTALFGLVHAIMRVEWGGEFIIAQHQVLRVWDFDDAALAETLMSVVASSYWYEGGMNMSFAGGGINTKELENRAMEAPFLANHTAVFMSGLMAKNLHDTKDKLARMDAIISRRERDGEVKGRKRLILERYEKHKKTMMNAAVKRDEEDGEWAIDEMKHLLARYCQEAIRAREESATPGGSDFESQHGNSDIESPGPPSTQGVTQAGAISVTSGQFDAESQDSSGAQDGETPISGGESNVESSGAQSTGSSLT